MRRCGAGLIVCVLGAACVALPLVAAADKPDFDRMGEFTAVGEAKEVTIDRKCQDAMIRVMQGTVIVNTFVIREGAKTTPVKIMREMKAGDKHVIPLGERRHITGFRISDGGGGTYRVYVR